MDKTATVPANQPGCNDASRRVFQKVVDLNTALRNEMTETSLALRDTVQASEKMLWEMRSNMESLVDQTSALKQLSLFSQPSGEQLEIDLREYQDQLDRNDRQAPDSTTGFLGGACLSFELRA